MAAVIAVMIAATSAPAQVELLPLDHPATAALVRMYEYGAIQDFPREQLPISRRLARQLLDEALADSSLPASLHEQARYHLIEIGADDVDRGHAVLIATPGNDRLFADDPTANWPFAILDARDSTLGAHVVVQPVLDGDIRFDPVATTTAMLGQWGLAVRGTLINRLGFAARVTNGSIAGDSALAARDPRIGRSGAFGITAFGRDIDFARAHARLDFDAVALEISRELMQLGGGGRNSLLVGSVLPSDYDALRFNARVGRVSFTHMHASLMPDVAKTVRGVFSRIPTKFIAAHLLSIGPFAGMRVSLGESVIYSERPFELGYLNPFNFLRSQEHYLRDRDNANMYASVSANPVAGVFVEGEFMLDDLKFSRLGDGFWGNKTAMRVAANARALVLRPLDIGLSYTRLEPYMYSHFSDTNAYTHDAAPLAAGGLPPNTEYLELTVGFIPFANLTMNLSAGTGRHGANIYDGDSLVFNAGGDVSQSLRGMDSETPDFLGGKIERISRVRLDIEYEPVRNVYVRLNAFANAHGDRIEREMRIGLRIGAH